MSKNLTRKSAAFGAVVALATTLFAGAPAFAGVDDGSVTIKPTTGTSYNALLNTDFSLDVNYVSGIAVNGAKLSALIEDSTSQVKAAFSQSSTSPSTKTFTSGSVVVESASTPDSAGAATADVLRLALPSTVTATTAVGVTVWYDSNADKVIDTNEKVAAKKTVTFYKSSDITWTAVLNAPTVGDTSLTGTITPSIVLNGQQIGDDANVIGDFGSSITNSSINTSTQSDYNSDNKNWAFTSGTITAATAGVTYSVKPYIIDATVGTRVYTSVATVTAAAAAGDLVPSADVTPDGTVRVGSTSATFELAVTKANGDAVAAGVPVKFSWSGSVTGYNSTTAPITLNGTAKASGAALTVLTDAKGVASVTVKVPATNVAGETVTLAWAAVEGVSGTNGTKALNFTAPDLTVVDTGIDGELYGATGYADVYQAVSGASKTLSLKVIDQWKVATTATNLEIKAVATGRTVGTTYTKVVAGAANVVIADGGVGSGTTTVAVLTLVKNASGSYTDLTSSTTPKSTAGTNSLDTDGVLINYVAATGSGKVTLGGTKANVAEDLAGTVHSDEIAAANTDVQNVAAPVDTPTSKVVGVITDATTGALLAGTEVTISGSGLLFNVGNQYGVGTLTFRANASAEFAVNVYANKATTGTVVTVASNGASATKTVVFTSALTPKSLTITAPTYAQAGTAVDVVATVADKWGNGVSADSLTISSTGPGYLNATGSTTTLTSGVVRAKLILGAAETGNVVITATTTNTNGTFATAANRTVTAAITVGVTPAAAPAAAVKANVVAKTKAFSVSVSGNASAKNVVVKVAGKTVATLAGSASAKTYTVKATKGSKKVTVYVGGKLIATKTVSVK